MRPSTRQSSARPFVRLRSLIVGTALVLIAIDVALVVGNYIGLDEVGRSAAYAAARAYRSAPTTAAVERAVRAESEEAGDVVVTRILLDETAVYVDVHRAPELIVLDRLPGMRRRLDVTVTQSAVLDPVGL